jgi:hypothetical protein
MENQAAGWLALLPDLVGDFVDPTHVIEGERATTGSPFFFTRPKALSPAIVLQLSLLYRTSSLWLFLPNNTANKLPRIQLTRLTMPAPSAAQQKQYVSEVIQVTQTDSKTAAKLLAKSNWNTSAAINAYVDTLRPEQIMS